MEHGLDIRLDNIGVAASSPSRVAAFFRNRFGATVREGPHDAEIELGGATFYVFEAAGPRLGADRSPTLQGNHPGLDHVSFHCADIDAAHEALVRAGVDFDGVPEDIHEWGLRAVAFRDPERNLYFLIQRLR